MASLAGWQAWSGRQAGGGEAGSGSRILLLAHRGGSDSLKGCQKSMTENPAERIFCAVDTDDLDDATGLAGQLAGAVGGLKIGLQFFTAQGPAGVRQIAETGAPIFLDLKLHDIPNTVAGAVRSACALRPSLITVHAAGGAAMMRAAAAAILRASDIGARPMLIAVTVLTSFDDEDLGNVGYHGSVQDQAVRMASLAQTCGMDGVVASAYEIEALRRTCGPDFKLVVPGIRPGWATADDQKRVVTPAEAIRRGADYLVIGRPITRADDPRAAAERIAAELGR